MKNQITSKKIEKIFKTSTIFDIVPPNRWWEKEKFDLEKVEDDEDNEEENNKSNLNEKKDDSENSNNEENQEFFNTKNTVKFKTLEHNGVIFPSAYQPHGVKIKFKEESIELAPHLEELATFWAQVLDNDLSQKEVARKNYFKEFKTQLLKAYPEKKEKFKDSTINDFDFSPIHEYLLAQREKNKNKSKEEKLQEKEKRQKQAETYGLALVDGYAEKLSNNMVEPPGLYRRRGDHPGSGKLKNRILPEDISINVGPDDPVPICNLPGHSWKMIQNNTSSTWLAMYKEDKQTKYVFLAGNSKFKGMNDLKKYEKARKVKGLIETIREDYYRLMATTDSEKQQLGVATYLIDILALRVGNEKGDDEADTVGCCSLRVEHIKLNDENDEKKNFVTFDFLAKDSMRYLNTCELDERVVKLLRKFVRAKKSTDDLFENINVCNSFSFLLLRQVN